MLTKERTILLAIGTFFAVLAVWVIVSVVTAPPRYPGYDDGTACTMEAMLCPDGSSVGRIGPNCEFAPCPGEAPAPAIPRGKPIPQPIPPAPIYEGGGEGGSGGGAVACTMDAKMCPDGSYVGRTAPNCEFAPCPTTVSPPSTSGSCTSDSDCAKGYSCIDASPVIREGTQNLRCWKDGTPTPICLSGETRIATPKGEVFVKNIRAGDMVWSMNDRGEKIAVPVLISSHTNAPVDHRVIHLRLYDGRELFASPGHSIAGGRTLGSLLLGDVVSGSVVVGASLVAYDEAYTYDILPDSASGAYWANGILLESTL